MLVRENELEIDYAEEIDPYVETLSKAVVRGNKLQACSPFREEHTPSFAVNLDNGTWIDSGAMDGDWFKGNFTKLLAFLMGVTYEEAETYLIEKYRLILDDVDALTLNIQLEATESYRELSLDDLKMFAFRNSYLTDRGISEQVQRSFKIGYDNKSKAVVIPWFDKDGNLINIKFRNTVNKVFWYLKGGQPIKQHIYGLHFIYKMKLNRAFVVESETDALYLWSHGIPAIALGSASLSTKQEDLIINSPIEELVLAFDKDDAGNRAKETVGNLFMGKKRLYVMPIPDGCKDINDIQSSKLITATKRAYLIEPKFL